MEKQSGKFIICIMSILCFSETAVHSQILDDPLTAGLVKKGISQIYNHEFDKARISFTGVMQLFPGHPVEHLSNAMIIYWENFPLLAGSEIRTTFEKTLWKCIEICEQDSPPDEGEYLLTNLCARGLLLLFYRDNGLSTLVLPLAAQTYKYIRHALSIKSKYYDFCFFTGLYNYYREAIPQKYPVYYPLAIFLPHGNEEKGLKQLSKATDSSIVLKAESLSALAGINLKFENNYREALHYNKTLSELYPDNIVFRGEYIKNLLLEGKYDEAEKQIRTVIFDSDNMFFKSELEILNGIVKEKKYRNYAEAEKLYSLGAHSIAPYGDYGNEYAAYANYGLSRISDARNDRQNSRIYRKRADALAVFKNINFD